MYKILKNKIENKTAKIGIVGLGYVGLPLAVAFAEEGFEVFGIDTGPKKVSSIKKGESYIIDVPSEKVERLVSSGLLNATDDYKVVKKLDAVVICVPTPLGKTREPDVSFIVSAIAGIIKNRRKNQLYILESTTYPGTTEEILLPKFKEKNYKIDRDFLLAFSPERVDPSNRIYTTNNIPKVVGGVTRDSTQAAKLLYNQIVDEVIPVSSSKVAEMTKLLENTFRSVNIGLVNELARMCERMHINVWEVINAAKTKPFGFMPFYPGPGIGGHCINIDPLYLSWKAKLYGFDAKFIELADHVNSDMPRYVVQCVMNALNDRGKAVMGSKVLVLGVAYKKDVDDLRESPSLEIMKIFLEKGAIVTYSDPHASRIMLDSKPFKSAPLQGGFIRKQDCVVLATDHTSFDYKKIQHNAKLVFDTRNAFAARGIKEKNILVL
ncbi:MAG: nucleotide sugar dehydrogenase [Candidatus Omnitrophica bacterium]|nr:nucleotide sugar dehydrogenase [Candidatus Omnitrophota bacterium]MBU4487472.1 nucleotide sugar dehydrogenase [Candidatus Omnitrophota bacterium]MCG2705118.1 nucleotide sugar dehydrogenase [Candidatus Omnitrophota bacterium]